VGEAFAEFAGLGVPEVDAVADLELVGGAADQRRLYLARALFGVEPQAGRQERLRQAAAVADPRREVAPAQHGDHARARPAYDREREQGGRAAGEVGVVVEQDRLV
jgi:hypothetical protein